MDRFSELNEFIDKAKKMMVRQAERNDIEEYIKRKNYFDEFRKLPKFKISIEKYEKSEKGQIMRKRRNSLKHLGRVKNFYNNTPYGYQVDHIIPLALGDKHILENLQYLTSLETQRKPKNKITTDMKVQLIRNRFIRRILP